jgi:MFS family permease|tara:strand:+ start:16980 stop:18221 length:1242 start_codon:yes stop_codon:yes gene_type:complete
LPRPRTFDAWVGYRDYRFLWTGNFCANTAQWLQLLSLGWLIHHLTEGSSASSLLVVTVGGINTLPGLVVGPWGGVLGDRIDRRKLVISIQAFMAVFAFSFAFLVRSDAVAVWHVYVYAIVSGACLSVSQPMRQALIANTVPREAMINAYAANVLTIPGTRMIGPFVGGIIVATLGFFWNFTIESMLYVGMILAYLPMKTPYTTPRKSLTSGVGGMVSDLVEGLRFVWSGNRVLFLVIMLTLVPNVALQPVMFLLPVFTSEVLGKGADVGGYMMAASGLGGLIMAVAVASFGFVYGRGRVCLATAIISCSLALALSQALWLPAALVGIAVFAGSQTTFRTTSGTLIQTLTPDELRGRVTSLQRYGHGFVVASSLTVGWLAGATSVTTAMLAMGVVGLAVAVPFAILSRRLRDQS